MTKKMNSNRKTSQLTDFFSAQKTNQAFEHLQTKLKTLQDAIRLKLAHQHTFVIVPSFRIYAQRSWAEYQAYEERLLYFLGLLRQPNTRIIYITSNPVSSLVKTYHLNVMAPDYQVNENRLFFIEVNDKRTTLPLTEKLLTHSKTLAVIKKLIHDKEQSHIIPYQMTTHEQTLAVVLNVPIYGCHPKLLTFSRKGRSRKLFRKLNLTPPFGYEDIKNKTGLVKAINKLRLYQPNTKKVIIKWNHGVSGLGNAVIDLTELLKSKNGNQDILMSDLDNYVQPVNQKLTCTDYFTNFSLYGGIIETYIADHYCSPSVQLEILPDKSINILSTAKQIMAGIAAQHFSGCRFPVDDMTSSLIQAKALVIAHALAAKGVMGFLAVDFLLTRQNNKIKQCYPIEINLRLGGAINPLLMLQLLTNGQYHAEKNKFITQDGNIKYFIEHDDLASSKRRTITPKQLYDIIQSHGLQFSEAKQTGIIVHMVSALETCHKFGLIAIGNTPKQAEQLGQEAISIITCQ